MARTKQPRTAIRHGTSKQAAPKPTRADANRTAEPTRADVERSARADAKRTARADAGLAAPTRADAKRTARADAALAAPTRADAKRTARADAALAAPRQTDAKRTARGDAERAAPARADAKSTHAIVVESRDERTDRDRELRAMVANDPSDPMVVSVYADWLEEQGDEPRARFLRLQDAIRGMKVSHPKLFERGEELHALGKSLDREWVMAVTEPKLGGSVWDGKDDDGALTWRFLANGFINYTQPSGTFENGRWEQIGLTVAMETNAHYADYFGVIVGDTIRGKGWNIVDHKWRWKVKRTDDPKKVVLPDAVNRTIYDDHVKRRAAQKPKKRNKSKGPLRRTAPPKRKTPLTRKRRSSKRA